MVLYEQMLKLHVITGMGDAWELDDALQQIGVQNVEELK